MNLFKFQLNSVIFLGFIIFTIIAWIAFEFYHQQSSASIDPLVIEQANTPIMSSFDETTLNRIYESSENFYESNVNQSER
jgi:uncharacterized membrane protein YkgB